MKFIVLLIAGAVLVHAARAADLTECEVQPITGDSRQWSWRTIDGKRCWYIGEKWKPKHELRWATREKEEFKELEPPEWLRQPMPEKVVEEAERPRENVDIPVVAPSREEVVAEHVALGLSAVLVPTDQELLARAHDELLASTCCWPPLEKPTIRWWILIVAPLVVGVGALVVSVAYRRYHGHEEERQEA